MWSHGLAFIRHLMTKLFMVLNQQNDCFEKKKKINLPD